MAKTLSFEFEGKSYTLEFTRRTVQKLEAAGFNGNKLQAQPMTMLPVLFRGAFLHNHPKVKEAKIDQIFSHMTNKDKLIEALVEMYNEPLVALVDEPEDDEKNVVWTASF